MRKRRFTKARIIGMHKEQGGWDSRELQARHSWIDRPAPSRPAGGLSPSRSAAENSMQ
jgi:hypothetical protein